MRCRLRVAGRLGNTSPYLLEESRRARLSRGESTSTTPARGGGAKRPCPCRDQVPRNRPLPPSECSILRHLPPLHQSVALRNPFAPFPLETRNLLSLPSMVKALQRLPWRVSPSSPEGWAGRESQTLWISMTRHVRLGPLQSCRCRGGSSPPAQQAAVVRAHSLVRGSIHLISGGIDAQRCAPFVSLSLSPPPSIKPPGASSSP